MPTLKIYKVTDIHNMVNVSKVEDKEILCIAEPGAKRYILSSSKERVESKGLHILDSFSKEGYMKHLVVKKDKVLDSLETGMIALFDNLYNCVVDKELEICVLRNDKCDILYKAILSYKENGSFKEEIDIHASLSDMKIEDFCDFILSNRQKLEELLTSSTLQLEAKRRYLESKIKDGYLDIVNKSIFRLEELDYKEFTVFIDYLINRSYKTPDNIDTMEKI